jgi:hypothetical protein
MDSRGHDASDAEGAMRLRQHVSQDPILEDSAALLGSLVPSRIHIKVCGRVSGAAAPDKFLGGLRLRCI